MQILSEFERKAWDARDKAGAHNPRTALLAIADDIEAGHKYTSARHIIVVVVDTIGEDRDLIHVVQSGPMETMAGEGALARAISILQQGAD